MSQKPSAFEDVTIEFAGKKYTIPANMMMGAINRIEKHVTLKELSDDGGERGTLKMSAVSSAYASALRFAGADVADDEVYSGMFAGGLATQTAMIAAVSGLLTIMIPPAVVRARMKANEEAKGKAASPGEANRQARRAEASLSRKRSKRRS